MGNKVKENRSIGLFILFKVLSDISLGILFFSIFFGALVVLFSIICGIYNLIYTVFIILFYRSWIEDINLICDGDGQHTAEVLKYYLLNLVTFGIYSYFWEYNLQNRLKSNASRYNVVISESGSTVLLWDLLGAFLLGIGPLISLHIMFESTNRLAFAYNQNYGGVSPAAMAVNPMIASSVKQEVTPMELPMIAPPAKQEVTPMEPPMITPPAKQGVAPVGTSPVRQAVSSMSPPQMPSPQHLPMGQVKCIKGTAAGQGFRIPANARVVVGKNPSKATLVINESYISNVHCTIQYNAGNNTYIVTDYSTNGTFANGIRLQKGVPMAYPAGTVLMLVNKNIEIKLG